MEEVVELVDKGGVVFVMIVAVSVLGWFCALRGMLVGRGWWLRFAGSLSVVAPLLGLLGTVRGMESAFEAIRVSGATEPGLVSGGVSEALLTTEAGLVTALPLLLLSRWGLWRLKKCDDAHRNRKSR